MFWGIVVLALCFTSIFEFHLTNFSYLDNDQSHLTYVSPVFVLTDFESPLAIPVFDVSPIGQWLRMYDMTVVRGPGLAHSR